MEILLVAATALELAPLLAYRQHNGHHISSLITGVGQVAVTWSLMDALQHQRPDMLIQVGIGGQFGTAYPLGDAVLVAQDCFGDLGMEEKEQFNTVFEKGFAQLDEPPYTNGWLVNHTTLPNMLPLPQVKAVTVNKVSDSVLQQQQLVQTFNPVVESMEGAAFHYVCLRAGLPFVQIRGLSNLVGERDKSQWQIGLAVERACAAALRLIDSV